MKVKFRASLALWVSVFTYQDFSMIIPSFVAYSQMLLSILAYIFSSFQWEGWIVYLAHHIIRNRR